MKRPVLLAVEAGASAYAGLLGALIADGERVGWLDLGRPRGAPPADLEEAASRGVLRAVAASGDRVITVKPVAGGLVLDDLLREHFLGCRLVLVRRGEGLPVLVPDDGGWRLAPPEGTAIRLSTSELVTNLRRPGFWRRLGH